MVCSDIEMHKKEKTYKEFLASEIFKGKKIEWATKKKVIR